ncbi:hypothetical protein U1Q18_037029 [Sarracenia purpurea var. burkii]
MWKKLQFPPYPENPLIKQYSAEYWIMGDLMTPEELRIGSFARRVFDAGEADVVFVPFFATLSAEMQLGMAKGSFRKKVGNEDYDRQRQVVDFVKSSEAWKRSGGRDHVFVLTDPVAMWHVRADISPAVLLVVDFGGWFRLDSKASNNTSSDMIQHTQVSLLKDVIVPYTHLLPRLQISENRKRPTLLYFKGAKHRHRVEGVTFSIMGDHPSHLFAYMFVTLDLVNLLPNEINALLYQNSRKLNHHSSGVHHPSHGFANMFVALDPVNLLPDEINALLYQNSRKLNHRCSRLFCGTEIDIDVQREGGLVREKMWDLLVNEPGVIMEEGFPNATGKEQSIKGMRTSEFCLHPAGDTPTSCRLFDAVQSLCIPVIVSDDIELPFEGIVDYSEFSVFIAVTNALQPNWLVHHLRSFSDKKKEIFRQNMARVQPIFQYDNGHQGGIGPIPPDGTVNYIWRKIHQKLPVIKEAIVREKRKPKGISVPLRCHCT